MRALPRQTRRQFFKTSAKAAVAGTLVSPLSISRAAHAAASHMIRVGLVGCGGRGAGAVNNALDVARDVRLVAVGDVFEDKASRSLKALKEKHASRVDVARDRLFDGFDAYRGVLQSDVDLVILATPPGFRPLHFEAAVQAGKHVFMEKAFAVDAPGYRRLLAANEIAKRKSLKIGTGLQSRHETRCVETVRRIQAGEIGEIRVMETSRKVRVKMLRFPRRDDVSEMDYQIRNPLLFVWLSGDTIVDFLIHNLDTCHWVKGGAPEHARPTGNRKERDAPEDGEIFDPFHVEYTYADGTRIVTETNISNPLRPEYREHVTGTLGTADIKSGKIEGRTTWEYRGANNNPYQDEQAALIDAIRNDKPYNETESGAVSNMMAIMGRMAAYEGREIRWDEAVNSDEAYLPERYALDADPPTLPDKFGDYVVPARGRRHSA
jgi:predicted dehydrogenase